MSKSLQEQLLAAGLVDKKQVKQTNKNKRKLDKQQRNSKSAVVNLTQETAQQALKDKRIRDRELNKARNQRAERREIIAQIKQLIDMNKVSRNNGETAYNFVDNKKVKKLYVTQAQSGQLSRGQLAIASLQKSYELIPIAVARKIAERDSSCVIISSDSTATSRSEEEYADYKIPDDLMW